MFPRNIVDTCFLYELTNQKEKDLKTNYSFYNDMIISYNKYTCIIWYCCNDVLHK